MKIQRIINAAIGATLDRRIINQAAKGKISKTDVKYVNQLEKVSGPAASSFKQRLTSWHLAYQSNLDRIKLVEKINAPFKKKSVIKDFIGSMFNK